MRDIERKIFEMSSDSRYEEIRNDLKLLRYQYMDYCHKHSHHCSAKKLQNIKSTRFRKSCAFLLR